MDFKEIDKILMKHSLVRYNFDILNPINKKKEFKKFQIDNNYNPQFLYNEFDASKHIQALEHLEIPTDSPLGILFDEMRNLLLIEAKALGNIGTDEFNVNGLFAPVNRSVVLKAQEILHEIKIEEERDERTIPSVELGERMIEELERYECDGWRVTYNEHASARASVSAGRKIVTIKSNLLFSPSEVTKLIVHEIGTHVVRAVNGSHQEYEIFSLGLPRYLNTEEGLAGFVERLHGIETPSNLRYYALSALITYLCAHHSFVEVYDQVRQYFKDDWSCFKAVARPKRGLGDTSKPGGYLKDHCYLAGLLLIEKFVEEDGDLVKLYSAKMGIQHLHLVDEGIIKPAKIVPNFIKNFKKKKYQNKNN